MGYCIPWQPSKAKKVTQFAVFNNSAEPTASNRRLYAFPNGFHGDDEPTQSQQLARVKCKSLITDFILVWDKRLTRSGPFRSATLSNGSL